MFGSLKIALKISILLGLTNFNIIIVKFSFKDIKFGNLRGFQNGH